MSAGSLIFLRVDMGPSGYTERLASIFDLKAEVFGLQLLQFGFPRFGLLAPVADCVFGTANTGLDTPELLVELLDQGVT